MLERVHHLLSRSLCGNHCFWLFVTQEAETEHRAAVEGWEAGGCAKLGLAVLLEAWGRSKALAGAVVESEEIHQRCLNMLEQVRAPPQLRKDQPLIFCDTRGAPRSYVDPIMN